MAPVAPAQAQLSHQLVALDLLRGLAAFAVFFAHMRGASFVDFASLPAAERTPSVVVFFGLTRLGQEAVLTFFVLSGFLVGGQIIARLQQARFDLPNYAIDRCTRILLPLIPACLFTALLNAVFLGEPLRLADLLGNIVGLNEVLVPSLKNNVPLWSLAYEIWFYILAGAAGYAVSRRRRSVSPVALAVLALGALVFSILSARYLLYWGIGAIMYLCVNTRFKVQLAGIGAILAVAGTVLHQLAPGSDAFIGIDYVPPAVAEAIICIGICLTLPALRSASVNRRLARWRLFAALISGFSYTLYLTHYPTVNVINLYLPQGHSLSAATIANFVVRSGIGLLVAGILYFAFERNTAALRRYIRRRLGRDGGVGRRSVAFEPSA